MRNDVQCELLAERERVEKLLVQRGRDHPHIIAWPFRPRQTHIPCNPPLSPAIIEDTHQSYEKAQQRYIQTDISRKPSELTELAATMEAVRSVLQPITHNLPAPIRDVGVSLLGPQCYTTLLDEIDISDTACLKLAVSKGLGVGIIGASSIVKVPQILKLVSSQSGEGISVLAYVLETAAYLVGLAYNVRNGFPFSTFGETALIMAQNVMITALVLHYKGRSSAAGGFVAALAACVFVLFGESFLDMGMLKWLQAGAGVLGVASKVPQIMAIWQQGGTGQLSAFAVSWSCVRFLVFRVRGLMCLATGLQLPRGIAVSNLHDAAGGGRQVDIVRLHIWLCAQRCAGVADGVLLERAVGEGQGQEEGGAGAGAGKEQVDFDCKGQTYDSSAWIG